MLNKYEYVAAITILFLGGCGNDVPKNICESVVPNDVSNPSGWSSIALSYDGERMAAAEWGGYIYTSADSGRKRIKQESAGSRWWYSITSSGDGVKLAAIVWNGYVYTSSDGGTTWVERNNAGQRYWSSITISEDGTKIYSVVNNGYIYYSPCFRCQPPICSIKSIV